MPLYEFQNKETGESVGELILSLEARDDFLQMNPNLCVKPGKLRLAIHKTEDSFPSYPDMNQETRTPEERGSDYKPALPSSWVDSDKESGKTGIKITDKRKVKRNYFEEDIKKYGKITGTPKAVNLPSSGSLYNSVDSDQPGSAREQQELNDIMSKVDKVGTYEREVLGQRGWTSDKPIHLNDSQHRNPWEKGYAKENKHRYENPDPGGDQARIQGDIERERDILGID
tara:strand:- start:543 stop:1226 length:684 start_codon:yes stop_codon:yes gene_type:complete